jgi:hypothetical protein
MKLSLWEWLPFRRWRVVGQVEAADEIPERLPKRAIVVVRSAGQNKWLGFRCPCGKEHEILLNLDPDRPPAWRFDQSSRGKITIFPSIDYLDSGRRCHFHLRNNKVLWAKHSVR